MTRSVLSVLLAVCLVLGCRGARVEADDPAALAEAHLRTFSDFDQWARRACNTEQTAIERKPEALQEIIFSHIRNDHEVIGAWIELQDLRGFKRVISHPGQNIQPGQTEWKTVRDAELGIIKVAYSRPCGLTAQLPPNKTGCVLVSRQAPLEIGELIVTVAYAH